MRENAQLFHPRKGKGVIVHVPVGNPEGLLVRHDLRKEVREIPCDLLATERGPEAFNRTRRLATDTQRLGSRLLVNMVAVIY